MLLVISFLDPDSNECEDVDECADGTHDCKIAEKHSEEDEAQCINNRGGYECKCPPSYRNFLGICYYQAPPPTKPPRAFKYRHSGPKFLKKSPKRQISFLQ